MIGSEDKVDMTLLSTAVNSAECSINGQPGQIVKFYWLLKNSS